MLGLSVRVMPLLSREVQMSDITVNGLNLTLSRDEQGRGNWKASASRPVAANRPASRRKLPSRKPNSAKRHRPHASRSHWISTA